MAKIVEEEMKIKVSKLIRDNDHKPTLITKEISDQIEEIISELLDAKKSSLLIEIEYGVTPRPGYRGLDYTIDTDEEIRPYLSENK